MNACWFISCQTAVLSVVISLTSHAETYETWAEKHFTPTQIATGLAAPHGDHDGDMCPNILEYCGNTLPLDGGSSLTLIWGFDPALDEVTVRVPVADNREDIDHLVLVSNDLVTWTPRAVLICPDPAPTFHLNGHRYVKVGAQPKAGMMLDSDRDGLNDYFEETLVLANPDDAFHHIGQILPDDDFDGDGTPNIEEDANRPASPAFSRPPTLSLSAITCALRNSPPPPLSSLVVHTILK